MIDTPNWAASCRPGTVLMFRFPNAETGEQSKKRPCLVIAASADGRRLTLAYGTTAITDANRGLELAVAAQDDRAAAGLHHPSRFVLSRRVTVAAADPRFVTGPEGDPIIGVLTDQQRCELAASIESLGAAIGVDCLRGLPRHHSSGTDDRRRVAIGGRRRIDPRVVVVEHRRRRRVSHPSPSAA